MTFSEDAARALPASAALFRFDPNGIKGFDFSIEGFIRSFWVMLPVGIVFFFLTRIEFAAVTAVVADPPGLSGFMWVKMAGFIVDFLAFPIVMVPVCQVLGLGHRYVPVVVVNNWLSIIAIAIWAVPAFLYAGGVISEGPVALLSLFALFYVVAVVAFAIRNALETSPLIAAAITALYLVLSLVIGMATDRVLGL